MDTQNLNRLKNRLFNRLPLIGGWLRLSAARQLAADPAPAALEVLALAWERFPDPELRAIIQTALDGVRSPAQVDAVTAAWMQSRSPALAALIRRRNWLAEKPQRLYLLNALLIGRTDVVYQIEGEMVDWLLLVCEDRDPQLAEAARSCLPHLQERSAMDRLCERWLELRSAAGARRPAASATAVTALLLEAAILQAGYVARSPARVRVLSALKVGRLEALASGGADLVSPLLLALTDPDPEIAANAQPALAGLKNPKAQTEVCKEALAKEDPLLTKIVLQAGYAPQNEADRALFFFLTDQWVRYEELDFDHRLLRTQYDAADAALRQRIQRKLRQAGRVEYLSVLSGRGEVERLAKLPPNEIEMLVAVLMEQQQWPRLWELVFQLSPQWGLRLVTLLGQAAWQPAPAPEQALLAEMLHLAAAAGRLTPAILTRSLPQALRRATARLSGGRINAVSFAPAGSQIAIATSGRRLLLWDYRQAAIQTRINRGPDGQLLGHSIGQVAFTQRGDLLFAERTNAPGACRLYGWRDEQVFEIIREDQPISALQPLGETQVALAARNQFVTLFDLDGRPRQIKRQLYGFWARDLAVSRSQKNLALLHQSALVVEVPQMQEVARTPNQDSVITSGVFLPDGSGLVLGQHNGRVAAYANRSLRRDVKTMVQHKGRIVGLAALQRYPLVISAGSDGLLNFTHWPSKNHQGQLGLEGDPLTSLHVSPDESYLVTGYSDTRLEFWDLRVQELGVLFERPLSLAAPAQLATLNMLVEAPELPEPLRPLARFLWLALHHRFRFDIELAEADELAIGEFEIEID